VGVYYTTMRHYTEVAVEWRGGGERTMFNFTEVDVEGGGGGTKELCSTR